MTDEPFTPEQIAVMDADAAEAEAGYSIDYLESLPSVTYPQNWHPEGWGQIVQFRYPQDRVAALDQAARKAGMTRSKLLRDVVDAYLAA
jgi:hypothetical protein